METICPAMDQSDWVVLDEGVSGDELVKSIVIDSQTGEVLCDFRDVDTDYELLEILTRAIKKQEYLPLVEHKYELKACYSALYDAGIKDCKNEPDSCTMGTLSQYTSEKEELHKILDEIDEKWLDFYSEVSARLEIEEMLDRKEYYRKAYEKDACTIRAFESEMGSGEISAFDADTTYLHITELFDLFITNEFYDTQIPDIDFDYKDIIILNYNEKYYAGRISSSADGQSIKCVASIEKDAVCECKTQVWFDDGLGLRLENFNKENHRIEW